MTAPRLDPLPHSVDLVVGLAGVALTAALYSTPAPFIVAALFLTGGYGVLLPFGSGWTLERGTFLRVFAVGMLIASIGSIYLLVFRDPIQLGSDAALFFQLASGSANSGSLAELQLVSEGALAVLAWRAIYQMTGSLGIAPAVYIGTFANVTMIAWMAVATTRLARSTFGPDPRRLVRLRHYVVMCGLFWLFMGVHLRDAAVVLAVAVLVALWGSWVSDARSGRKLSAAIATSLVGAPVMGALRTEFVFVPLFLIAAAAGATVLGRSNGRVPLLAKAAIFATGVGVAIAFAQLGDTLRLVLEAGAGGYADLRSASGGADSLGDALIGDRALPVRLVLGSIYLFAFPIPFWVGFQLESAYHLFKSLNSLFFFLALVPALLLAFRTVIREPGARCPPVMFLILLAVGFTGAVAATSLESRHLGAFLPSILVLALLPDLAQSSERRRFRLALAATLAAVGMVHLLWAALRLVPAVP